MNDKICKLLSESAEEFGNNAKKVNESSKKRKQNSEEALSNIVESMTIDNILFSEIESVAKKDIELRDKDNLISNTCKVLSSNISFQKELLGRINKFHSIDKLKLKNLEDIVDDFSRAVDEASLALYQILDGDNELVFMDKLLMEHKRLQIKQMDNLKSLTIIAVENAENAIEGSSKNLERSMEMVKKIGRVKEFCAAGNRDEIEKLIMDSIKGYETALKVNRSSTSQYEFADKVNSYTHELHHDAISLKNLVNNKHKLFEENLQVITVLTVIISIKFKQYMEIENIIKSIEYSDDIRDIINELHIYTDIACSDVKLITELSLDMTELFHVTNAAETKTVALTNKQIEHYNKIKSSVIEMTEATGFPVEGSEKNMKICRLMEENLREILKNL